MRLLRSVWAQRKSRLTPALRATARKLIASSSLISFRMPATDLVAGSHRRARRRFRSQVLRRAGFR